MRVAYFSPIRVVSMYCVSSIYLFSIFNGRIPQLLSAPEGGTRILSVTQSLFSLDIQWILSTHTFHLNVSVCKDDFHFYQAHLCHSETQNSVTFDIQKFDNKH